MKTPPQPDPEGAALLETLGFELRFYEKEIDGVSCGEFSWQRIISPLVPPTIVFISVKEDGSGVRYHVGYNGASLSSGKARSIREAMIGVANRLETMSMCIGYASKEMREALRP